MATAKKTHTVHDVDQSYEAGVIDGMAEAYTLMDEVVLKLQESLLNAQAIYYIGDVVGKKAAQVAELQVAFDTLTHLRDMVSDAYFEALDEEKARTWRDSIASLKEEWPL